MHHHRRRDRRAIDPPRNFPGQPSPPRHRPHHQPNRDKTTSVKPSPPTIGRAQENDDRRRREHRRSRRPPDLPSHLIREPPLRRPRQLIPCKVDRFRVGRTVRRPPHGIVISIPRAHRRRPTRHRPQQHHPPSRRPQRTPVADRARPFRRQSRHKKHNGTDCQKNKAVRITQSLAPDSRTIIGGRDARDPSPP